MNNVISYGFALAAGMLVYTLLRDAPAKCGKNNGVCCTALLVDRQICRLLVGRKIALLLWRARSARR